MPLIVIRDRAPVSLSVTDSVSPSRTSSWRATLTGTATGAPAALREPEAPAAGHEPATSVALAAIWGTDAISAPPAARPGAGSTVSGAVHCAVYSRNGTPCRSPDARARMTVVSAAAVAGS